MNITNNIQYLNLKAESSFYQSLGRGGGGGGAHGKGG